jgi:hypothetical protein
VPHVPNRFEYLSRSKNSLHLNDVRVVVELCGSVVTNAIDTGKLLMASTGSSCLKALSKWLDALLRDGVE